MKQFPNTTPAPQSEPFYAAGHHLTPDRLARQDVKAFAAVCLAIAAIGGSIAAAIQLRQPWPVPVGAVIASGAAIYARSLRNGIANVRRALWHNEEATGYDIDGDGHVGPPPSVGHVLPIGTGPRKQEVVLPDLDPPKRLEALPGFPTDPVVTPNDVVFILTNSVGDGLAFATWTGRRLPSGAEIQRDTWTAILDGLLAWQFATASSTANGRRIVALRSDIDVEDMIKHIKTAVEQPVRAVQ